MSINRGISMEKLPLPLTLGLAFVWIGLLTLGVFVLHGAWSCSHDKNLLL